MELRNQKSTLDLLLIILVIWSMFTQILLTSLLTHFDFSFIGILHWLLDHLLPFMFWIILLKYPKQISKILSYDMSKTTQSG